MAPLPAAPDSLASASAVDGAGSGGNGEYGAAAGASGPAHTNDLEGDFEGLVTDMFETDRRINTTRYEDLHQRTQAIEAHLASIAGSRPEPY